MADDNFLEYAQDSLKSALSLFGVDRVIDPNRDPNYHGETTINELEEGLSNFAQGTSDFLEQHKYGRNLKSNLSELAIGASDTYDYLVDESNRGGQSTTGEWGAWALGNILRDRERYSQGAADLLGKIKINGQSIDPRILKAGSEEAIDTLLTLGIAPFAKGIGRGISRVLDVPPGGGNLAPALATVRAGGNLPIKPPVTEFKPASVFQMEAAGRQALNGKKLTGSGRAAGRGLSDGQLKLLEKLTPEAISEVSDPGLRMLYGKAAKMLNTPGLSKRNAEALLQTGPDSGLIELLKGVDNPVVMDKAITSYFTRNPIYFSGGYGFNLDHLVPISSTSKLASKVKPAVFQDALALQLKKFGRKFAHDQEFSLMPRNIHAAKHTGVPEIGDLSPDWKTKYLDGIIDSLPENASVEQVSEALSQMYDTSLYHTGQALQSKKFFEIREAVLESLPPKVQEVLGENFDITGRMSSVEDPVKWKYFLGYLRQAPGEMKAAIREMSQVKQVELSNLKDFRN